MGKYDDIINQEHPRSKKHAPMPLSDRAAQFAPFAALTGHEELMDETARLTDRKIELDESRKEEINRVLMQMQEELSQETKSPKALDLTPEAADLKKKPQEYRMIYFVADPYKAGGFYKTVTEAVKKLDMYRERLVLTSGEEIPIENLWEIEKVCKIL